MEYTTGDIIEKAKVISIKDFGAFVEISPSQNGLIYFSQIVPKVAYGDVASVLSIGDEIRCAVSEIKPDGKISLTMKIRKRIERKHQIKQVKKDIANLVGRKYEFAFYMDGTNKYSALYAEIYAVGNSA